MFSAVPVNSGMPIPTIPQNNFCPGAMYNNVPFHQPYSSTPFYSPMCNNFQNTPYNPANTNGNINGQLSHFNNQIPMFTQPPPGYMNDSQCMSTNPYGNSTYHPMHLANVCSTPYPGFPGMSVGNQFSNLSKKSNGPRQNGRNFATFKNNRQTKDAKEYPYYCENCDRGFLSMNQFSEHKSEHIICGKQGCTFTAHPGIVEKHIMMQHRTGLFNRIVKGNSPEEIEKWIAERKKHFPTKNKIEEKHARKAEMDKRGERYAEKRKSFQRNPEFKNPQNRFGKSVGKPPFRSNTYGRRGIFPNRNSESNESQSRKRAPIPEDDCVVRNLPPFKGTAYYLNFTNDVNSAPSVADSEDSVCALADPLSSEPVNNLPDINTSLALLSCYQSDSEDDGDNCCKKEVTSCSNPEKSDESLACNNTDIMREVNQNELLITDDDSEPEEVSSKHVKEANQSEFHNTKIILSNVSENHRITDCDSEPDGILSRDENNSHPKSIPDKSSEDISSCDRRITDEDSEIEEIPSKSVQNIIVNEAEKIDNVDDIDEVERNNNARSNESKKRKRKRRKDDKSEDDGCDGDVKLTPEERMPQVFHSRKRYRPPTLLEKLLAQEIKHERNVVLQCVRYVVENNYFNIGQTK